jgi:Na+/phosphate symporter
VFNLANALLFVPFTTQFAALVTRMLPDRPELAEVAIQAKYLDVSCCAPHHWRWTGHASRCCGWRTAST